MVKGENTLEAGTPVSFDVLTNEIRGLGLNMQLGEKPWRQHLRSDSTGVARGFKAGAPTLRPAQTGFVGCADLDMPQSSSPLLGAS